MTQKNQKVHAYLLIEVWDREINYKQFATFEEAQKEMKGKFPTLLDEDNASESELGEDYAWVNGDYAYDAKIIQVA